LWKDETIYLNDLSLLPCGEVAMAREIISAGELVRILNEELAKHAEDSACEFTMIDYKLPKPDDSGCNWHSADVIICNDRVPPSVIEQLTARIISEVKKKYNVE
jgi:hypothetical protein